MAINQALTRAKRKAISALFPYALRLGRSGKQRIAGLYVLTRCYGIRLSEVHMASCGIAHHEAAYGRTLLP